MKLDDLRKAARSGITKEEPEKPKGTREIDLTRDYVCPDCGSSVYEAEYRFDALRNVQLRRFECLQCGSIAEGEVPREDWERP